MSDVNLLERVSITVVRSRLREDPSSSPVSYLFTENPPLKTSQTISFSENLLSHFYEIKSGAGPNNIWEAELGPSRLAHWFELRFYHICKIQNLETQCAE